MMASQVCCVLNINHTFIFNELWKGFCEEEDGNPPENPTSGKALAI